MIVNTEDICKIKKNIKKIGNSRDFIYILHP